MSTKLDSLVPTTMEPEKLQRQSLRLIYDHEHIEDRPLTQGFFEVLRPIERYVPQANLRAWIYVLKDLQPNQHPEQNKEDFECTSKALCDEDLLALFPKDPETDRHKLPPWTRAVLLLTIHVVADKLSYAPDDHFLEVHGLSDTRTLRPSLYTAVEEFYDVACQEDTPAGPMAMYWLARALQELDGEWLREKVQHVADGDSAEADGNSRQIIGLNTRNYMNRLLTGETKEPLHEQKDPVLKFLHRKLSFEPDDDPNAVIPGKLQPTYWEMLLAWVGGSPDKLTRVGQIVLGVGGVGLLLLIWGFYWWTSGATEIKKFEKNHLDKIVKQLELTHDKTNRKKD